MLLTSKENWVQWFDLEVSEERGVNTKTNIFFSVFLGKLFKNDESLSFQDTLKCLFIESQQYKLEYVVLTPQTVKQIWCLFKALQAIYSFEYEKNLIALLDPITCFYFKWNTAAHLVILRTVIIYLTD